MVMLFRVSMILVFTLMSACSQPLLRDMLSQSKEAEIFYHVFQRSFYDSNGDRHGDFNGLVEQLDYLDSLGVNSILMTPVMPSSYYHNYFPDNFEGIDPEYGTLEDYLAMVGAIHDRGMRFYMDMEIHYVTEKHVWFEDSFKNPNSEYDNYILYRDVLNTEPETMIFNLPGLTSFDGDALKITTVDMLNEPTKEYLYTLFKYWVDPNGDGIFDDGVDGFRIDHMMDDIDLKGAQVDLYARFWKPLFDELRSINPHIHIIAEQVPWADPGGEYFSNADVDTVFAFNIRDALVRLDAHDIGEAIKYTFAHTPERKHQLVFVENHDIDRVASVLDGDSRKLKLIAAFSMLSKGIPLIYYGQEIGMQGRALGLGGKGHGDRDAEQRDDMALIGHLNTMKVSTMPSDIGDIPRRQAFRWAEDGNAPGHTQWYREYWQPSTSFTADSLEVQKLDKNSIFNEYLRLIAFRKQNPVLSHGVIDVKECGSDVLCFVREDDDARLFVVMNFASHSVEYPTENTVNNIVLASSQSRFEAGGKLTLPPYGYVVLYEKND